MTNREAIELLKIERDHMTPTVFTERVEAMDMAISALQAQDVEDTISRQPEPCEDAVSRDLVKFLLCKETCHPGAFCPDGFCMEICEKVDALPSVTPKCPECDDAVSREAAIDAALFAFSRGLLASPDIQKLPSVQPEPHWIPVSERLPDMPIRVLVQLDNGWIITAYRQDNEWFSLPAFGEAIKDKWVEAWMPLPEPYRAERRTDERSD